MSDQRTRATERDAKAGDTAAAERLRHERCRRGECCAHAGETVPLGTELYKDCVDNTNHCSDQKVRLRRCGSYLCVECCDHHACIGATPGLTA